MKAILFTLTLTGALLARAQAPERFSYQAVIRDAGNALVVGSAVGMQLSILQGSSSGPAVYVETQTPTTNANGLVSIEVGAGTPVLGSMAGIDWSAGPYFLKSETDPAGGTAYSITGVQQLLSVPYALFAANGGTVGPPGPPGPAGPIGPPGADACGTIHTADGRAVVYTGSVAHGFGLSSVGGSSWYTIALSGPVLGAIACDTSVVIYTASVAYGFGPSSVGGSNWYTIALSSTPLGAVASSGRIVVYTDNVAYGFGASSVGGSNWYSSSLSSTPVGAVAAGNRIVVYTNNVAYGFGLSSVGGSNWYTSALGSAPEDAIGTR